jgi:hypothetical protein
MNELTLIAIAGWVLAVLMMGLWLGERRMRVFIQHYTTFGGTPQKARLYTPPDAEDNLDAAIDKIEGIAGTREARRATPEDAKYTAETLNNGVQWLMDQAREAGSSLSLAEATEEAERMLNAEGTEM